MGIDHLLKVKRQDILRIAAKHGVLEHSGLRGRGVW